MLSKKYRFHGHNSLNYVYKKGSTARTEFMSLRSVPSRRPNFRLAVVVSKKVNKSAVIRNRIRRRIYEAFRVLPEKSGHDDKDLVISVFDDRVAEMPIEELRTSIKQMLKK